MNEAQTISPLPGYIPPARRQFAIDRSRERREVNVGPTERLVSTLLGGALVVYGLGHRSPPQSVASLLGAGLLLHRGVTGRCQLYRALGVRSDQGEPVARQVAHQVQRQARQLMPPPHAEASLTIGLPAQELYDMWRDPDKLTRILAHIAEVTLTSAGMRWSVSGPMDKHLEWDTQIVEDLPGELLRWQSVEGATVRSEGWVRFRKAPADWGTEVTVSLRFEPPGGVVGNALARLLAGPVHVLVEGALRRFKSLAETGEIATLNHNPSGRREADHLTSHRAAAAAE